MKILALDLGASAIKHGIVQNGKLVNGYQITESHASAGGAALLEAAQNAAAAYSGYERIGLCSSGQINPLNGTVSFANQNIPQYSGTKLREIFEKRFNVPVAVENDVNAMAVAEGIYGAAKKEKNYLCLTYGTGIGGAIVIDKKLFSGARFSAGEVGHIITHVNGKLCACGGRGCYEQYASAKALSQAAHNAGLQYTKGSELLEHLSNHTAANVLDLWLCEVSAGLVSLINIFNPSCVVLGGAVMENPAMLKLLQEKTMRQLMPCFLNVELKSAVLGNAAGLLGAAYLAQNI